MAEQNPQDRVAELELQLEEANNKNASLQASNDSLTQANTDLAVALETANSENASLQASNDSLTQANADLAAALEAANAEVLKLQGKNAKYENPSFENGGSSYEVLAKNANIPGKGFVTAADIAADPELQDWLVSRASGLIRKKA